METTKQKFTIEIERPTMDCKVTEGELYEIIGTGLHCFGWSAGSDRGTVGLFPECRSVYIGGHSHRGGIPQTLFSPIGSEDRKRWDGSGGILPQYPGNRGAFPGGQDMP